MASSQHDRPRLVDLLRDVEKDKQTLVGLLRQAAHLEHCLLNTYLFAACSLKTLPEEFAELGAGEPNIRRAIQFERVRDWKLSILNITHEEMMHLHYVQCLLRALGEPADFTLPDRSTVTGSWQFTDWRPRVGSRDTDDPTEVPVERLTAKAIRRFVLYEATDALQDSDPFSVENTELFDALHDIEVQYRVDEALLNLPEDQRAPLRTQLLAILRSLLPGTPRESPTVVGFSTSGAADELDRIRFQSIADLYNNEILPRYRDAFTLGQVVNNNRDLNDEFVANTQELLPIGPIKRDRNFERQEQRNIGDPLANYSSVESIIAQIVDEGEGMSDFVEAAREVRDQVKRRGVPGLLEAVRADQAFQSGDDGGPPDTPPWLQRIHRARNSHLYRFAMIRAQFDVETRLHEQCGRSFDPARSPADDASPEMTKFTEEAVHHFNACYLVLRTWLARFYGPRPTPRNGRRLGLELIAGWPMMSVAIRPFLEMLALLPIRGADIFRSDDAALEAGPAGTTELNALFKTPPAPDDTDAMDEYALGILAATAAWAKAARGRVASMTSDATASAILTRRLEALSILDEFQRQVVYREFGGYSAHLPTQDYPGTQPLKYEEIPLGTTADSEPMFADSLVLRLRFSGRCLVQLATDPDPPTDEAGCSGTMMLFSDDGSAHLDRALVMQPASSSNVITREPRHKLPPLGVQVREIALLVTDYPSGTSRTVPTPGADPSQPPTRFDIDGLNPILVCHPEDLLDAGQRLGIDLLDDPDGRRPYLNGENHLVWEDGEPIDPFIIAVTVSEDGRPVPRPIMSREIYNEGRTLLQMDPLQRARSGRGPVAFDRFSNAPDWVQQSLSDVERRNVNSAAGYLDDRATALAEATIDTLSAGDLAQPDVDRAISLLERRRRVVSPPRTTTVGWLSLLLHYGHTVSGSNRHGGAANLLLERLATRSGFTLEVAENPDREHANGRWMATYSKGYMDTDQLSDLTYGELLIPLRASAPHPGRMTVIRSWTFAATADEVKRYACTFSRPFGQAGPGGPAYAVIDKVRELHRAGFPPLRETLIEHTDTGYRYGVSGLTGLIDCEGEFRSQSTPGRTTLTWTVRFGCQPPLSHIRASSLFAAHADALDSALRQRFTSCLPAQR